MINVHCHLTYFKLKYSLITIVNLSQLLEQFIYFIIINLNSIV